MAGPIRDISITNDVNLQGGEPTIIVAMSGDNIRGVNTQWMSQNLALGDHFQLSQEPTFGFTCSLVSELVGGSGGVINQWQATAYGSAPIPMSRVMQLGMNPTPNDGLQSWLFANGWQVRYAQDRAGTTWGDWVPAVATS